MDKSSNYREYAYNFIKEICETVGPRYACSIEERTANERIRLELDSYCDQSHIEDFTTCPNLFPQGIIRITFAMNFLAFFFIVFATPFTFISTALVVLSLAILFFELVLIKGWLSFLFKKETSSNVYGILEPTSSVKRTILFEGHTDSAKQMRLARLEDKLSFTIFALGFVYIFYTLIFSFLKAFLGLFQVITTYFSFAIFSWTILDWLYYPLGFLLFICFLFMAINLMSEEVVPGANDNLSGTAVTLALAKFFSQNRLENVRLIFASMGSEECGEQGAAYFAKNHRQLLGDDALVLVYDCVGVGEKMLVVEQDFMHLTKYDEEIIEKIEQAYQKYLKLNSQALPLDRVVLPMGSSDASAFRKKGYQSTFLLTSYLDSTKPPYWHTLQDNWDIIDPKVLENIIGLSCAFAQLVDDELSTDLQV